VFAVSNERVFLGIGLSEISSAGLVYLAGSFVLRSRRRRMRTAVAAGVFATLAFYTRLNNLPFAAGAAALALPLRVPAVALWRPSRWWRRVNWRTVATMAAAIAAGLVLFAWRTWYYTGVFSVFHGTARDQLAVWQPGLSPAALFERALSSVMMVLTLNDPARFDPYALPILGGAAAAVLALIGVPRLRSLPLAVVLFFLSALAGALVARGTAYSGRFSLHVIPVTCALAVATLARLTARRAR
jgi:hypothetical protein